ncbi:triacylglycerol lipase 2-like [Actinidia eriantha]|uniref:triacylglycerol lipase 2-like n=1 Tax=Actinidia eriantha TaxID=165200 RepID=UPI00258D34E7|nr:triacylglycerol lipase 2-like [Actinidia eriantha]
MTWLLNSSDESLAFILADSGFDVWISNIRGTRFSRRHVTLDPRNSEFWNWTWDDLVTHDLSSVIDFVFKQTGQKMDYVGHSMGTLITQTSFLEGRQKDKMRSAALLNPIAYLSHMTTALGDVAAKAFVRDITTLIGLAEFNPNEVHVANFLKALCAQSGVDCYGLLTALTGKNCCLNISTVEFFLKNEPQSTSTKNMVHLAQNKYTR